MSNVAKRASSVTGAGIENLQDPSFSLRCLPHIGFPEDDPMTSKGSQVSISHLSHSHWSSLGHASISATNELLRWLAAFTRNTHFVREKELSSKKKRIWQRLIRCLLISSFSLFLLHLYTWQLRMKRLLVLVACVWSCD